MNSELGVQDNPDKIQVPVTHPDMGVSRVNKVWAAELCRHPDPVIVRDLYAAYRRTREVAR